MLLIRRKKNIWRTNVAQLTLSAKACPKSTKLHQSKLSQYCSNAFQKHWNKTSTICLKAVLQTRDIVRWWFSDSLLRSGKQPLCSSDFFCSLASKLVCNLSGGYTRCVFYRIFSLVMICFPFQNISPCVDDTFLVPNEFHDNQWRGSDK